MVTAAGEGERWALTQLFRTYQPMLLRYLRSQARDVADDLAGEVWVATARGIGSFAGDEPDFRRWLFTVARRRLIEHWRRTNRRRTDPVPQETLDQGSEADLNRDPASVVAERLSAQAAVDLLAAELTPDQAEAVMLRIVAGLDVADAARVMGRSAGSVRVLCHRALRQLAARFPEGALAE